MEKIRVLKDEHKKSREEVKVMKKQLSQLKNHCDDLTEANTIFTANSTNNTVNPSNSAAISVAENSVKNLTLRVNELTASQETILKTSKVLKDKLRDCSKQLQVCIYNIAFVWLIVGYVYRISYFLFLFLLYSLC